jgi:hypothetical protein
VANAKEKGRRGKGSNAWKHKKEKGGLEHFGTTMIKKERQSRGTKWRGCNRD